VEQADVTIIGAGVVGLSVASCVANGSRNVALIERHASFGQETSSRNSEVIHASIYYQQNSLKGRFCLEGNALMYELCERYAIPHRRTGKLIVAVNEEEEAQLPQLLETARNNGAKGVRIISAEEVRTHEPNVSARAAILCPTSGIVDSHNLMRYYERSALEKGAAIVYNTEVKAIEKTNEAYVLQVTDTAGREYDFRTRVLINCAGLESGNLSAMLGIDIDTAGYRITYCKGMYFRVSGNISQFPKMLIYPVPPWPGFVGIHTTPDLGGGMRLGPYDVWVDRMDYTVDESLREFFYRSTVSFLPFLKMEQINPDIAGMHPKIQKEGEPMKDFIVRHEADRGLENFINLVGIESPGLTSSPAIGKYVAAMVEAIS
jgi:L-2-hydroxyglutarate oxidase LhgO